jgi:hypothetical protein
VAPRLAAWQGSVAVAYAALRLSHPTKSRAVWGLEQAELAADEGGEVIVYEGQYRIGYGLQLFA